MARSKSLTDSLRRHRDSVKQAEKWRRNEGYDELWARLKDLYKGKHFPKTLTSEDRIAVNIAFATVNVISPSVSINHPKITVAAQRPDDDDKAVIVEAVVNYWWRHYEFKPEFRRAVKDFLIFGHGWIKTGYRYVEEERDRPQDAVDGDYHEQRQQADDFAAENPHLAGDLPTDDEIAASVVDTEMYVVEDRPFVERVSPRDMFVDPEATSMEDACWIAQRIHKDLDDVKNDERYKASARNKVRADREIDDSTRDGKSTDADKRVTVWEFYDLKKGTLAVFSEVGDDFLVDPEPQPYAFGHPFTMLRNYEVPDDFYPMGELEAIEDLQGELNKARSQQMNFRKRYGRKYLYDPRAFTKAAISALESDRDGQMVPVLEGVPLGEAMIPAPQESVDAQMFQGASEQAISDINMVTAVNEYQRGELPEIRRTATEASIIQDAANSRAAEKLSLIEGVLGDIARRVVQLAQQYMTQEQVARIVGLDGAHVWVPYERDFIQGEFDFEVEGGSTTPKNDTSRRQAANQLLQALAPLIPTGAINLPELLRHVLQEGFGIKDASRFLMQPPAPTEAEPIHQDPMANGAVQAPAGFTGGADGPPSPVQGIPPELAAQLAGQVGNPMGG